jgi:AcrR family transcriptional regulator
LASPALLAIGKSQEKILDIRLFLRYSLVERTFYQIIGDEVSPRTYRQEKRAASAEETRLRIVEAAMTLHAEQGIVATSIKDIAAMADVGIGTVYHHFPTYEDIVRACGARMHVLTRPPTPQSFAHLDSLDQRVERFVQELFAYYERYPSFERGRCDRDKLPVLAEAVARHEKAIEEVVREALRLGQFDEQVIRTTIALVDFAVYRSLTDGGLTVPQAADQVTQILLVWLASVLKGEIGP